MFIRINDKKIFDKISNPHLMTKERKPLSTLETEGSVPQPDR